MKKSSPPQIKLSERFSTACASAFFSGLLLVIIPIIVVMIGRGAFTDFELLIKYYSLVFSWYGAVILIVSGIMGFCLGADRMTNVYTFLMGGHRTTKRQTSETAQVFMVIALYVVMIVIIIYQ